MRVAVILRTQDQPDAEAGEAEGDTWPEIQTELATLLRRIADEIETAEEVPDAAPDH